MSATVNVGMLELDRKLSKVLDCARQQPVSVSRYGSPWVWVVSHETWIGQIQLTRYVPPRHPLVALREHIDDTLRAHAALLRQASLECGLTLDAAILCRTHILQLLYPTGSRPSSSAWRNSSATPAWPATASSSSSKVGAHSQPLPSDRPANQRNNRL